MRSYAVTQFRWASLATYIHTYMGDSLFRVLLLLSCRRWVMLLRIYIVV